MAVSTLKPTFPSFYDLEGLPLENGKVFIGEASKNAETNPVNIFFDEALTIPAAQPLQTSSGYVVKNGAPANIFINGAYSITVKDKNDKIIYVSLSVEQDIPDEFSDDVFRIIDDIDVTKKIGFQAAGIGAGFTRIITMPNNDVDLGDIADIAANTTSVAILNKLDDSVTIDMTADANQTLTASQIPFGRIEITDIVTPITAPRNITVDTTEHTFLFVNNADFALTVKTPSGTGISVASGEAKELRNDTVDIIESEGAASVLGTLDTNNFLHIQDQKTSGTTGGANIAGTQTRTLNTILENTITGASLSTNIITLPIGTYYITASSPAVSCNIHKARLFNISDTSVAIVGSSEFITTSNTQGTRCLLSGNITIASTKTFRLEHFTQSIGSSNGLGVPSATGDVEVYSDIQIWKVA